MIDAKKYQPMPQTRGDPYFPSKPFYQVASVKGRKGAENFPMAPNSSILLLDEDDPIIWFTTADSGGTITAIPYDYSEHIETREVSTEDLCAMIQSLSKQINRLEERMDGKPDNGKTQRKRSDQSTVAE
jgi:hypothetical protein